MGRRFDPDGAHPVDIWFNLRNGATKCVQKLPVISVRKPHGLAAASILKKHSKVSPNQIDASVKHLTYFLL